MTGVAGGLGLFFWKIIDKRFDQIDKKFEKIDERFETMWNKIDERFAMAREEMLDNFRAVNNRFEKVDKEISEVKNAVFEVKERLAFLEAETILYNIIPNENKRSEAAKRMWERKRQKKQIKHTPAK